MGQLGHTGGARTFSGRRQPSRGGTSRMMREYHVRICERLGVKFPGSTRHFETKSDACHCAYIGLILLQKLTFWRPARAAREARGFSNPRPQIVVQFGAITLSTSLFTKLRGVDDERPEAKRNSLADKLTVEAKALADLS